MGVEIRIHTFFVLLAFVCLVFSKTSGSDYIAGLGLWLLIVAAVVVREAVRLAVAAWLGRCV